MLDFLSRRWSLWIVGAAIVLAGRSAGAQGFLSLRIETAPGGNAPDLASTTRVAGDSLRLFAATYDFLGFYAGPAAVDWSIIPGGATLDATQGTTTLVQTSLTGQFHVQAVMDGTTADTGNITVVPGPPSGLAAFASPAFGAPAITSLALSADSSLVLYTGSYDKFSNWTGPIDVAWSLDAPIAAVTPSHATLTVLDPRRTGNGHLWLDAPSLPRLDLPLAVTHGRIASLLVSTTPGGTPLADTTLVAGQTLHLEARAADADGNSVTPFAGATWSATGTGLALGAVNGVQTDALASLPGSARIVATAGAIQTSTGIIRITAGILARLRVSRAPDTYVAVDPATVDADQNFELFALGQDAAGHWLGPVSATWTSTDAAVLHSPTTTGPSAVVDCARIGTARLRLTGAGLAPDSTGAVQVTPGRFARLTIESLGDGTGSEMGALGFSADSVIAFHAVGRDADGNFVGARNALWSLTGPIGSLSTPLGPDVVLLGEHPGTALLTAVDGIETDVAGPITVTAGAPYRLRAEDSLGLALAPRALAPGETASAVAMTLDRDGNQLTAAPVTWGWLGDALALLPGSAAPQYNWTAGRVGQGRLVLAAPGLMADTSATFTVVAGSPARLEMRDALGLPVGARTLSCDALLELHAWALDGSGNELGQVPVTWSVLGTAGSATVAPLAGSATVLRPVTPGVVRVAALHGSGVQAQSGDLTLVPGQITRVTIETAADGSGSRLASRGLAAGDLLPLFAVGRDGQGNFVAPVNANWFESGGIGTLSVTQGTATILLAEHRGRGRVTLTVPLIDGDETGILDVTPGPVAALGIERSPAGPADALGTATVSVDDSLMAFAVVRDVFGNWIATVPAFWSVTGPAGAAQISSPGPATATVLRPQHPAQVQLTATWNGFAALSGPLALVVGRLATVGIETAADGSGFAIGNRTLGAGEVVALYAIGRDALGNLTGAVTAAWSVVGIGGTLDTAWQSAARFTADRPGLCHVTAAYPGVGLATTGALTVTAGTPASLVLERAPGDPFDPFDTTALAAGDSVEAYAVLRDGLGNWVGNVVATWSVLGSPTSAILNPTAAGGVALQARHPGSVRLQATWNGRDAVSGTIDLGAGAPAGTFMMSLTPNTLRAGGPLPALGNGGPVTDAWGNDVADGTRIDVRLTGATGLAGEDLDPVRAGVQRPTSAGHFVFTLVPGALAGPATVDATAGTAAGRAAIALLPPIGIGVLAGSFTPIEWLRGAPFAAHLTLVNPDVLALDLATAELRLDDGNGGAIQTSLAAPVTLQPGMATGVDFVSLDTPGALRAGRYTPRLHVTGQDQLGSPFDLEIGTAGATLDLVDGAVTQVTGHAPLRLTQGTPVHFTVDVLNSGDVAVQLDAARSLLQGGAFAAALAPGSATTLARGTVTRLDFVTTIWPLGATVGDVPLDLELHGTQTGGAFDASVASGTVRVDATAALIADKGALTPVLVPQGASPAPRITVQNAGGSAVTLNTNTQVQIAGRAGGLVTPVRVGPDSAAILDFAPVDLGGLPAGLYSVWLSAQGTQNGAAFAQDVALADSLTLFAPAALTILGIQPSQATVTAGQTASWLLRVVLSNSGATAYRIDAADVHIVLGGIDRTATYTMTHQKPFTSALPPAARDTLDFLVTQTGPDAGLATLEAAVQATDLTTGLPVEANTFTAGKGSLRVQNPAIAAAGVLTLSQPAVVAGQTAPVEVTLTVRNAGEAILDLDPASLAASFVTAPAIAVVPASYTGGPGLAAGESMLLRWTLGPFTAAPGSLQLTATPQFVERNRAALLTCSASTNVPVQGPAAVVVSQANAPASVTVAQAQAWTARFQLTNSGGSSVTVATPRLVFAAPGAATTFGVTPPLTFEDGRPLQLAPGAQGTLAFVINRTDATARRVTIGVACDAVEELSGRALTIANGATATVSVQAPPAVQLVDASLAPARAAVGQVVGFTLDAQNTGESRLDLDATQSWARLVDGTTLHSLMAPAVLPGGGTATLRFAAAALDGAPGAGALRLHLAGTENGNAWSADLSTGAVLRLDAAAQLEITAVRPSRPRVTRRQTVAWTVRAAVRNHGGDAVLDAATLGFTLGAADVATGFTVTAPAHFESGTTLLVAGAADTLRFDVTRTLDAIGLVALDATLHAHDANSGTPLVVTSVGQARGSVQIDAPAEPVIATLQASQALVSAGQRSAWRVQVTVRNDGGSPWRADWTRAALVLGAAPDDSIACGAPAAPQLLDAGESEGAVFTIHRTGAELGAVGLVASLPGVQESDGAAIAALPNAPVTIVVQRPAAARLETATAHTQRPGTANTGQTVRLDITVRNSGEADLRRVAVQAHADGATPADSLLVAAVPGGGSVTLHSQVRLRDDAGPAAIQFTVLEAYDANDSLTTAAFGATTAAHLDLRAETPGSLALTLVPSQGRVSAGQAREWSLAVQVENVGEEPLVLRAPRPSDIEFQRSNVPQSDYVVLAPAAFDEGGLTLAGAGQGTLRYRITRTGDGGGSIAITATASALHANDATAPDMAATAAATIAVDAEPSLRILSTDTRTWRRDRGFDDDRVDAGQAFAVRVVVENTGGTQLDSIGVDVESQRGNSHLDGRRWLDTLAPGQRGELEFAVVGGTWLSQPGLPEAFTAHIAAAQDLNTGISVLPGAAVDATTFAYIETPAQVALTAWIDAPDGARDGVLSAAQEFILAARLDNEGSADFSASGRVALGLPAGYAIVDGDPEQFADAGQVIRWTLQAGAAAHAFSDTLVIALAAVPLDENRGTPAIVRVGTATVAVAVRATGDLAALLTRGGAAAGGSIFVSTGQTLDLDVVVRGDADLIGREADLVLPAGWSPAPGSPPKLDLPPGAEARTTAAVQVGHAPGMAQVILHATAVDRNDESPRAALDTLQLQVVRAARLAVDAAIVAPDEARDGRLLPGQAFQVRAWVRNQGDAAVVAAPGNTSGGTLRLIDVPAGYGVQAAEQPYVLTGREASITWNLTAPPVVRPGAETMRIVFAALPFDANAMQAVGLDPDSTIARCVVSVANDAVAVDATAEPATVVAPGERDVTLLHLLITNQAEAAVRIDAVGVAPLADGVILPDAFAHYVLTRDDDAAIRVEALPSGSSPVWIDFGAAGNAAILAPGATARWTLRADIATSAAARTVSAALRTNAAGAVLVRASESSSGAAVPVHADARATLASAAVRVLGAALAAYNAPNPFHAEREPTTIHYQVDGASDVTIRIQTLQGALVWETHRHEAAVGTALRGVEWDGRNGTGQPVRNGVYVCSVQVGTRATRFKIAVTR